MKVSLKEILEIGKNRNCAIPAFNVYNMETVLGVMHAAEQTKAPVIFQVYSRLFDGENARFLAPEILEAIDTLKTPAAFHLDHGAGMKEVMRAIRYGATGVMRDASRMPMEENIAETKEVVRLAGDLDIGVEGELGHIGVAAKDGVDSHFTEVEDAVRFAEETKVDALAVAVGTAHGHYPKARVLGIDRIREIGEATDVHLVLHGGSGVPDDQIRMAVAAGIRKINFGTDVCCSFLNTVYETDRSMVAVDLVMEKPVKAVTAFCVGKIRLLGADHE